VACARVAGLLLGLTGKIVRSTAAAPSNNGAAAANAGSVMFTAAVAG